VLTPKVMPIDLLTISRARLMIINSNFDSYFPENITYS
jgi:hypothetical protein